jgi:hypothetical protein
VLILKQALRGNTRINTMQSECCEANTAPGRIR